MALPSSRLGGLLSMIVALSLPAEQVVISKLMISPRPGKPAYLEVFNNSSTPYDIAAWRLTGAARYDFPDFSTRAPLASFLRPFERIVLSSADPVALRAAYPVPEAVRVFGPWKSSRSAGEDRMTLKDKNGVIVCRVSYDGNGRWPATTEAAGHALVLSDPDRKVDDWRNWTLSPRLDDPPGTAPAPPLTSLVPSPEMEVNLGQVLIDYSADWRFEDTGRDPGPRWREPDFADAAWRHGPGLLGWDRKPLPKPGLQTRVNFGRQITYCFRHSFVYSGSAQPGDRLIIDQIIDDGVIYHLNGREIGRSRLPAGRVGFWTLSSSTVPDATEELTEFVLDPALLIRGTNLLAAEVHQCKGTSSDIVFGMRLRLTPPPKLGLVINEVLADAKKGFIEFCNSAAQPLNLKGCFLSDTAENLRQHRLTNQSVLPPGGLAAVSLAECGLHDSSPLALYLTAPDGQTVLSAVLVNFADDGRAIGRRPDGSGAWFRFAEPTRGQPNPGRDPTPPPPVVQPLRGSNAVAPVVISEIMYDPPYGAAGLEFVELYNRGARTTDLSGWRFSQGISFVFPTGTALPPGGYLVVAANADLLRRVYGEIPVVGDFKGRLRHDGELLCLADAAGHPVNEVDFKAGGDWPVLAHGGGSSMELIHPWMDNARSSAWRDSDETSKSAWQTYACTNVYLELNSFGQPNDYRELQLYLVGHGHVALRKVGLYKNGINYLDHPDRVSTDGSSATGWLAQGNHAASFLTNGELHVVSDGHGDNRADRLEIDCVRVQRGERYELRFEGRWISGCPRLVVQTWDHSIGRAFLFALPPRLGTPGQPNSISGPPPFVATQAAPQLDDLLHSPPVPRSTNTVRITARVASPAPLRSVRLFYRPDRADGQAPWASKPMFDDGAQGGDLVAGDGAYTAELTEHMTNQAVVQFYVEAVGSNGRTAALPRPGAEQPAMYVVDDRRIRRDLRLDRFVVSACDLGAMTDGNSARYGYRYPRLSNHRFNMTFISNEEKVFYGGGIRISGSPFTRGTDLGKGKWDLPGDRPFRGRTKFYFDNDSNYHNRLCRYLLYQLGHVTSEAEWIRVIINNSSPYLKEDTEPVTGEFLQRNFKDGNRGELYRVDDEWWFSDDWEYVNRDADWQYKGTDDPMRYRTEWQKRTGEVEDDYSGLIAFLKIYSANRYTQAEIERYLDADAILQLAAVRGYINDWDNFTMFRGKNEYFYRHADDGRFQFLQWDSDLAFREANYPFYGPRIAAWLQRPYNLKRFQDNLSKLVELTESPRLATWIALQRAANPARPLDASFYLGFFQRRNRLAARLPAPAPNLPLMLQNMFVPARPNPAVPE
jgi:hypothetical protein